MLIQSPSSGPGVLNSALKHDDSAARSHGTGKRSVILIALSSMLAFPAGPARAEVLGDILRPFASLTEMYDSNVFRVKDRAHLEALVGDSRLADFITVASVGTGVNYQVSRQQLALLLQKDFIRLAHYTSQDTDRDQASGTLLFAITDRVKLTLEESYLKAPQPRIDFQSAGLNTMTNLDGGVNVGYQSPSGVGLEAGYRRSSVDFSLAQYKSSEYAADRYSGTVSCQLSPEARLYAAYRHDETAYGAGLRVGSALVDNNSSSDSARLGLDKTIGQKTAFSGYIGYLNRRHQAASARNFSGVIGSVSLNQALTGKLGMTINWERQLYEETYVDRIYSVSDSVGAGIVYGVSAKLKATLTGRLLWKDFGDVPNSGVAPRTDFSKELSAGLEWTPIPRLSVKLGYQYSARNSDDSNFDFADHTVTSSVGYHF
jgi:opacity protein-like surface antigen